MQGYAFNKSYNQTQHATRRAKERYGIKFTPALNSRVSMILHSGSIPPLKNVRKSRYDVYRFNWRIIDDVGPDVDVTIAFDDQTSKVATFLPRDWTPESGFMHYLSGLEQRHELARLASETQEQNQKKIFEDAFNEVHPIPSLTGNHTADYETILHAVERLTDDIENDATFRQMRQRRLLELAQIRKAIKAEAHAARQASLIREAKAKRTAKQDRHLALLAEQRNRAGITEDTIPDNQGHAYYLAVKMVVEDRDLQAMIIQRARKLMKKIPKAVP